ncbi:MAG: hypothetical protein ACP5VE_00455 [Chthonomonadales bacterium]
MVCLLPVVLSAVRIPQEPALWDLARRNAGILRISTLFDAGTMVRQLNTSAGVDRAIAWCKDHGITHVYLEAYRDGITPPREVLERARDRFRAAGFLVSGCVTTTALGKPSTGWSSLSCYTDAGTQKALGEKFRYAASLFDEIMIDDFLCTDCACPECVAARGQQSWPQYRCDLMLRLSRTRILGAAKEVNPKARIIIKYPCWYEEFQDRGYDVERETAIYDEIWVGTETRGGTADRQWPAEPQYRAYWLMRWLLGIGGAKCGGGWYDTLGTSPPYYLEQARLTVLGGAREAMLFNYALLTATHPGVEDGAALREELPLHFQLARLIRGKAPRGLLGWKPPSSLPGPDGNLHCLLGMAGFPVTAAHAFARDAGGYVFGYHVLHDPGWKTDLRQALATRKPIVVSSAFLRAASQEFPDLARRAVVLPELSGRNLWRAMDEMPEDQLNALRDRATASLGIRFHAPNRVALFLFGRNVAVVENFRDEPVRCSLHIKGWSAMTPVLRMPLPSGESKHVMTEDALELGARSLVVLVKTR